MRLIPYFVLLLAPFMGVGAQVSINEFLPVNVSGLLDEEKNYTGWVELYNEADNAVDITGYGLSDRLETGAQWSFPYLMVPPKAYVLVYTSGKNKREVPVTFQTLIDMGDEWKYKVPDSDLGVTWRDVGFNDTGWESGKSGFGYADGDDSTLITDFSLSVFIRKTFTVNSGFDIARLILSMDYDDGFVAYINGHEVARSNLGSPGQDIAYNKFADASHEAVMYQNGSPSYFEVDNPGAFLVEGTNVIAIQVHNNIANSTDLTAIPFLTAGRVTPGTDDISPYLSFTKGVGLHTNFESGLGNPGIFLFNSSGTCIDSSRAKILQADVSFGRQPDGAAEKYYFGFPTPGAGNSSGTDSVQSNPVIFSPLGGEHQGSVDVILATANTTDSIYYTTDGSVPNYTDIRYNGPITITGTQVIRARVLNHNKLPGAVFTNTYITGLDHDLPIVCLTTDPENLWNEMSGIYTKGPNSETEFPYFNSNFWQDWERPIHVELYDAAGLKQIDQAAGMKIFGGWSRGMDQKSVALFARKSYGKGSFRYKFFTDKPVDKFESIILRNSGNDNLGLQFHDCFMTGLTRNMDIDRQAYQPAAVYINGSYWGLLNIREKISVDYVAENHFVHADSVNLLEGGGSIIDGNNADYMNILNYLGVKTTLQNNSDYNWVQEKISTNNFIQYQLTQIYLNNRDWPGNNIKFWNTTTPGSKWRWIIYDTDFGYSIWNDMDYELNTLEFAMATNGPDWPNPPWSTLLLRRMLTNPGFRNNFITQYCDRLNLDFHPDRINADIDSLKQMYYQEMGYTFNRWWGNYNDWQWRINVRKNFGLNRPGYSRQHMQSIFNLGSQLIVQVNVSDIKAGSVNLNSITLNAFPFSGIYFEDIPISLTAIPKPGYKFVRWEGSVTSTDATIAYNMNAGGSFSAVFSAAAAEDLSLIINEINYSSSPLFDTKDWIELLNNGQTSVDLTGWYLLDSGLDSAYFFPEGTLLAPGEYLVICRNLKDFRACHPAVSNIIGVLPFKLSGEGESIRLYDLNSRLVDAVNYGIQNPWPENVVQTGGSIELKNSQLDNSQGVHWGSTGTGGTPGKLNNYYVVTSGNDIETANPSMDCFPNPFRDFTTIHFNVSVAGHYRLEIIDMQGRLINVLADKSLEPGEYWIDWQGTGTNGTLATGGVFTIRLLGNNILETRKVIRLE